MTETSVVGVFDKNMREQGIRDRIEGDVRHLQDEVQAGDIGFVAAEQMSRCVNWEQRERP